MDLRVQLPGASEQIPFAQIGEKYLKNPEFLRIVSQYEGFLDALRQSLESAKGNVIQMAICVRELMCIDMISKTTDWGNMTPEDMMQIQGGIAKFGDAYEAYCSYKQQTGKSSGEIEAVTLQIQELKQKQGNEKFQMRVEDAKRQVNDGVNVIQGPWQ